HRRIKRGLVELVLDKDAPVVRQRRINLSHAFEIALQRAAKMLLARKIAAVTNPDGVGFRAQSRSDLDALKVVGDGLGAHRGIGMRETAKLVRMFLSGLVLERVRIHRIEMQSPPAGKLAQTSNI